MATTVSDRSFALWRLVAQIDHLVEHKFDDDLEVVFWSALETMKKDWTNWPYKTSEEDELLKLALDVYEKLKTPLGETGEKYVNVYVVTQMWGGHEEGGWWYDAGEPLESHRLAETEREEDVYARLLERHAGEGCHCGGFEKYGKCSRVRSAAGTCEEIRIVVEDHPAEGFPAVRPHYE